MRRAVVQLGWQSLDLVDRGGCQDKRFEVNDLNEVRKLRRKLLRCSLTSSFDVIVWNSKVSGGMLMWR